jgi:hypothetical protein
MKYGLEFKDMCGTKCWDLFYIERGLNMFIGILQTSDLFCIIISSYKLLDNILER